MTDGDFFKDGLVLRDVLQGYFVFDCSEISVGMSYRVILCLAV
jgi:hypothetical protein